MLVVSPPTPPTNFFEKKLDQKILQVRQWILKSFWFSFLQKADGVGRGNAPAPAEQIKTLFPQKNQKPQRPCPCGANFNVGGFTPNTPDKFF